MHFLNASRSEKSSASFERYMYGPFSDALNYGLECLSGIKVDGLPRFHDHIAFVPWDEDMSSDRALKGSMFKPDIVLMSFATACDSRGITKNLKVSQFVDETLKKAPAVSPHRIGWKNVLSAVEVKRYPQKKWPVMDNFTDEVPQITDEGLDDQSPSPGREASLDVSTSQSQTRKVHALVYKQTAEELYSRNLRIWWDQEADRE